jgi:hypothetical protein
MNNLIPKTEYLPERPVDLARYVLFQRELLVAVKAEIRAIDKLGLAQEVRTQKKEEAQMLAEALLDAEVKLGEMMLAIPKASGARTDIQPDDSSVERFDTKTEVVESLGFNMKQAERFETLAKNPDLVAQVKMEARENDELPTRTRILEKANLHRNIQRTEERIARDKVQRAKEQAYVEEIENRRTEAEKAGVVDMTVVLQDRYERECKDLDIGFMYYKHFSRACQEMTFIKTDIRELKLLVGAFDPDDLSEDIQDIEGMISKLAIIKSALMKGAY